MSGYVAIPADRMRKEDYDADDDLFVDAAEGLRETGGPTTLAIGAVGDGEVLRRNASTAVGIARAGIDTNATTHIASDGTDHSDVGLANTHRAGDGSDHADVATNTTHSSGDGSDHADVATNTTHAANTANPHATDIENLGSGTLAELQDAITDTKVAPGVWTAPFDTTADFTGGATSANGWVPTGAYGDYSTLGFVAGDFRAVCTTPGADKLVDVDLDISADYQSLRFMRDFLMLQGTSLTTLGGAVNTAVTVQLRHNDDDERSRLGVTWDGANRKFTQGLIRDGGADDVETINDASWDGASNLWRLHRSRTGQSAARITTANAELTAPSITGEDAVEDGTLVLRIRCFTANGGSLDITLSPTQIIGLIPQ